MIEVIAGVLCCSVKKREAHEPKQNFTWFIVDLLTCKKRLGSYCDSRNVMHAGGC